MNDTDTTTARSPARRAAPHPTDPASAQVAVCLYRALATGDLAEAAAHLDPDVALHVPGTHPLAGTHRGLDGVLAFVDGTRSRTDDGETIEVLDVLAGATTTAVHCRVTATRGDRRLDNSTIHLLRLRQGRVVEIHLHNFDGVAVDDFWS